MTRIIGPTGSRRRRRFLFAPILCIAALALFVVAGAMALPTGTSPQDNGLFQLDGNTLLPTCANPFPGVNAGEGDDWAALVTAGGDHPCGSDAFVFVNDGSGSADHTYWSQGGSKDSNDPQLGPWLWKPNDVSPDKNDLVNSFAALYHKGSDKFLYFGSDRFDTSGDAQQGFQFLQSDTCLAGPVGGVGAGGTAQCPNSTPTTFPATCNPSISGSNAGYFVDPGTGCPVHHKTGDLLILVNFNKGGTLGLAGVFEWVGANGAGAGSYSNVLTGSGANCATVTPPNDFCSIANTSPLSEPIWSYSAKGGGTTYDTSAFIEGGVNLAKIPGAGTCFPTFIAETRSSAGPSSGLGLTAQLKDLVFGKFQLCKPGMTTQASTNGTVQPGTAVHDTATIAITGAPNPADPTGTVTFHLCGNTSQVTFPDCTTGGTLVGTGNLVGGTQNDGTAIATSPDVNTAASATGVLANGSYCFRADWPGDSTYPGAQAFTDTSSECFRVLQLSTTLVTDPQSPSGTNNQGPFALKDNVQVVDHAVVTGSAAGGAPTGTVDFYICNPSQVAGTGSNAHCAGTGNTGDGTLVNSVTPLAAGPGANDSQATSSAVTANLLGVWCFRATYTSDTAVYTGSSGDDNRECFTVTTGSSGTSVQKWLPNDHVVVSTDTGTLTGTLDISLRSGTCGGSVVYQEPAPYDGSDNTIVVPIAGGVDTTNAGTFVNAANNATPYFWRIVFTPNSSFATGFTKCETTSITINNNP